VAGAAVFCELGEETVLSSCFLLLVRAILHG
jgi:hypothetical protein